MEFYQLKTFLKVAALKNITRAAEELNTSQPSVSAHIKTLEQELKVPLFVRTPRGMEITPEGEQMKTAAEEVLHAMDSMVGLSEELKKNRRQDIIIATNTYPEVLRMKELLLECTKDGEDIGFTVSHRNSHQIITDVKNGNIDCGFAFGDHQTEDLGVLNLAQIPMRIIGPGAWEKDLARCGLDELVKFPWIFMYSDCPFYNAANRVLKGRLSKLNITTRVDHEDQILSLVDSGLGISIIPEETLHIPGKGENLYIHPYHGMNVNLAFHYLKHRENDPAIALILKKLSQLWLL